MNRNEYYEKSIDELKKHAEVANNEMGGIQKDMSVLKNDVAWLKEKWTSNENKLWGIIVILIGTAIKIFLNL